MSNIINLNIRRKKNKRSEKEKKASENRIKYGRTKTNKLYQKQINQLDERLLENHKLDSNEQDID